VSKGKPKQTAKDQQPRRRDYHPQEQVALSRANSQKAHQRNRGGGKVGHHGHGRASICEKDADTAIFSIDSS
jgi:hypothetical protein